MGPRALASSRPRDPANEAAVVPAVRRELRRLTGGGRPGEEGLPAAAVLHLRRRIPRARRRGRREATLRGSCR